MGIWRVTSKVLSPNFAETTEDQEAKTSRIANALNILSYYADQNYSLTQEMANNLIEMNALNVILSTLQEDAEWPKIQACLILHYITVHNMLITEIKDSNGLALFISCLYHTNYSIKVTWI